MMNIVGKKARVRDRRSSDYAQETQWQLDSEVAALDPSVGKPLNTQGFSVETLDGEHIGTCSLYNQTLTDVQLGIRIGDRRYWDKGYGTEAVNILINYCFATMDIEYVWLKVLPQNTRAIKCYKKCGFVHTGRLALNGYDFITMEKRRI